MISTLKFKIQRLTQDKKFSEILTGSVWTLIARVLSTCLGFATSVIIARFYGANIVGIVAVINSILMLTTTLTLVGTNTSVLSLIPEHLIKFSASSAFLLYRRINLIVIVFSVSIAVIIFLLSDFIAIKIFSKYHFKFYIALSSIFIIFKSITLLNTEAVRALKLFRFFALMQLLPTLLNVILLVIFTSSIPLQDVPVYTFLISIAFTGLIGIAIINVSFKKRILPDENVKKVSYTEILKFSLPMFLAASMVFIIAQTGVIILGIFRTEVEVGYYAIAVKLSLLTSFAIASINSMAGPKFSELFHSNNISELFYVAKKSTQLIFWITSPILLILIVFGKPILGYVFGWKFIAAYPSLAVLSLGQFVHAISGSTGIFMNMTGKQKVFRNIVSVGALINISLNFIFIPKLGIIGAAISYSMSVAFWNISTLFYIKAKYGMTTGYIPALSIKSLTLD